MTCISLRRMMADFFIRDPQKRYYPVYLKYLIGSFIFALSLSTRDSEAIVQVILLKGKKEFSREKCG